MTLLASRLKTAEKAKIKARIIALFPAGGLSGDQLTAFNAAQDKIADAMSEGALETIPEITTNAETESNGATEAHSAGSPADIDNLAGVVK